MTLSKKAINEIYDYIVSCNLEHSLINQSDNNVRHELKKWLGLLEE